MKDVRLSTRMPWRFASGAALAVTLIACGPIPQNTVFTDGYRGYRTIPARTQPAPAKAQPGTAHAPSHPDERPHGSGPAHAPAHETLPSGPTGPREMIVVDLATKGPNGESRYHLIDPNRRSCYLQEGDSVSTMDCAGIPEAQRLFASAAPGDHRTSSSRPTPPVRTDAARPGPPSGSDAPAAAPAAPTREEKHRFAVAYIDTWCTATSGSAARRAEVLEGHGFTTQRYDAIERWMRADPASLQRLDAVARDSCPGTDA